MLKISLISMLFFVGCSNFTVNAAMCEQIAADPHATMPQECRNYVEKDAEKAFNKTKHDKIKNNEDLIEFKQEDKEE
jgi:hypothetical protein